MYSGQILGTVSAPRATATADTAFTSLIKPFSGAGFSPKGKPCAAYTHVSKVCYTTGGTAHPIYILRPFNYTTFSADAAASQAVVNITADPGVYSTNYLYNAPTGTFRTADNAIAANDYVCYQAADGTWVVDTVSSVSSLAITLSNNVPTGGVKKGGLFYFFGIATNTDPATGYAHPTTTIAASQTKDVTWADSNVGVVTSLHLGDPLIFYSGNGTAAGILEYLSGFYSQY